MGRWDDKKEAKTLDEFIRNSGCEYHESYNERYEPARYIDAGGNGSFMGLEGTFRVDAIAYDAAGRKIAEAKDLTDTYKIKLSPVQFYQTARQLMVFCNKEFHTAYDTSFKTPAWVRPTFCDVATDYDKQGFPEYLNMKYPLVFDKHEKVSYRNGAKSYQDAIKYNTYTMKEKLWGGRSWEQQPKGWFIGLADGFADYIKNAKDLPKGMYQHYNLYLMKNTEEQFGLKPTYTKVDLFNIFQARIKDPSAKSFTDEQRKVIKDFFFEAVTKSSIGKAYFKSFLPEFYKLNVPKEWIDSAENEFLDILNEEEMKMKKGVFHDEKPSEERQARMSR